MTNFRILPLLFLLVAMGSQADGIDKDACTSIMVGKKASADGSVITSHTCDSWYRTWMNMVPAQDYPRDTVMSIYEGTMHTEHADDRTNVKEKGQIPQVSHTYRYLNTAYPCLNEHQLGIGETTYGGRDTMENKAGMFMIEELARVALERCTTAREAIRLMGELIKKYSLAWSFILTTASLGSIIMPSIVGLLAEDFGISIGVGSITIALFIDMVFIMILVRFIKKKG